MVAPGASYVETGGWKKLRAMLAPDKLLPALEKNITKATIFNALLARKAIRENIQSSKFAVNAGLTILIKGSSKPLVGKDARLFNAITYQLINPYTVFVGAIRKSGDTDTVNLIELLHEGASFPVTPAMRGMFFYLWKLTTGKMNESKAEGRVAEIYARIKGTGKIIYPLKDSTSVITIPARPFMRSVFEDAALAAKMKANWVNAINSAITKAGGGL